MGGLDPGGSNEVLWVAGGWVGGWVGGLTFFVLGERPATLFESSRSFEGSSELVCGEDWGGRLDADGGLCLGRGVGGWVGGWVV